MKVVLVTHGKVNPEGHNGISRVVYHTTKYLRKKGVDCEILSVVELEENYIALCTEEIIQIYCYNKDEIIDIRFI